MIGKETILKISIKNQTSFLNTEREYCQHLFLSSFYRTKPPVYFKGGTALRIIYKSSRYSEDLDFSSNGIRDKEIEDLIISTLNEIESEGVRAKITESKATSGGYLSNIQLTLFDNTLALDLHISKRHLKPKSDIFVIANNYIPDYTLLALDKDALVKEKITACLDRAKPRDFYDIYFMLRSSLIESKDRVLLKKVSQKLDQSDISFKSELKEYLPLSLHGIISSFKTNLKRELDKYI